MIENVSGCDLVSLLTSLKCQELVIKRIREVIPCAVSLANHNLLSSVYRLDLHDVDLGPVSAQHLASLASRVTVILHIWNVSGFDLVSIFTSLKCRELYITSQSLGREETRALVQVMESGVETVMLWGGVTWILRL